MVRSQESLPEGAVGQVRSAAVALECAVRLACRRADEQLSPALVVALADALSRVDPRVADHLVRAVSANVEELRGISVWRGLKRLLRRKQCQG